MITECEFAEVAVLFKDMKQRWIMLIFMKICIR